MVWQGGESSVRATSGETFRHYSSAIGVHRAVRRIHRCSVFSFTATSFETQSSQFGISGIAIEVPALCARGPGSGRREEGNSPPRRPGRVRRRPILHRDRNALAARSLARETENTRSLGSFAESRDASAEERSVGVVKSQRNSIGRAARLAQMGAALAGSYLAYQLQRPFGE